MNLIDKVISIFTGQVPAARQQFQHGTMLWYDHDGGVIFAIADDGWWNEYADAWDGQSEPPDEPPAGLVKPTRGFGHVWHINSLKWKFGWATGSEQPGQGKCQETALGYYELHFGDDFYAKLEPPPPDPTPTPDPISPPPSTSWVWLPTLDMPLNLAFIAFVNKHGVCQFGPYDMLLTLPPTDMQFVREELKRRCEPSSN